MKKRRIVKHIGTGLLLGAVAGAVTGAAITLYKCCAKHVIHLSESGYHFLRHNPLWLIPAVIVLLGLAFLLAHIYRRTTNLRGGGIPTAIGVLRGIIPFRWVRNAIGILFLSLTTFLVGVPLGNEGPSVQLGTALGRGSTGLLGKKKRNAWDRYGMTCGACAGFSTATGAPLSGILFAVEEAHHRVSPLLLLVATTSVCAARLVSEWLSPLLGVSDTLFPAMELKPLTITDCWIPVVMGVVVGLFAVLFLSLYRGMIHLLNNRLAKVPDVYKIFAVLALTLTVGCLSYSYISTGHELVLSLFSGEVMIPLLITILLVRTLLTTGANVANLTGGIFLPLLAIGATLAALLGQVATACGLDAGYYPTILVLGITACIAGMMKMPLTAIAFAVEALSGDTIILPILLVSGIAYGVSELFGAVSINDRVLDHRLEQMERGKRKKENVTVTVQPDSFAVGKEIRDILWPNGVFVLSVDKKQALGGKTLSAGDNLLIRYVTHNESRLWTELTDILGEQTEK